MTAPPAVDAPDRAGAPVGPDRPGGRDSGRRISTALHRRIDGASLPDLDETDPRQSRPDPADGVVAVGEFPPLVQPLRPHRQRPLTMPTDRLRGWVVTGVLTLIGAIIRFWDLGYAVDRSGNDIAPLFDEKYYALEAAETVRNGGVEDNSAYSFIVHPPLGKQLIGLGEWLFGYNPVGWRVASATAGTLIIFMVIRVVRRMTRSTLMGAIGGVLIICESVSETLARLALLDVFNELFVLAAFCCLVADRDQVRTRLAGPAMTDFGGFLPDERGPEKRGIDGGRWWRSRSPWAGPALGARWWRFACGVFIGLDTGVKYSGIYYILAFGLLSLLWDFTARKEAGLRRPLLAVLRRDLAPSIWGLGVIPILTYVGTWWAWLFSETGYPRHLYCGSDSTMSTSGTWSGPCGDWKSADFTGGFWRTLADLWHNSLWQWTWYMLDFHSRLLTPKDFAQRHPWESKPWSWPLSTRPLLTYVASGQPCGDGTGNCVGRMFVVGVPALWWMSLFVMFWALWRSLFRLDWRYAAVLVGYGAGYLPWFFNLDRQMYFFYAGTLAPFLVIGVALVLGDILGRARVGVEKRFLAVAAVSVYVGLVVADFVWIYPLLTGLPITEARLNLETWLPSWG